MWCGRQIPRPVRCLGERVGVLELRAGSRPTGRAPRSRRGRASRRRRPRRPRPRTRAGRPAGRGPDPVGRGRPRRRRRRCSRWKWRAAGSVIGQARRPSSASSSQPARVRIARQASSQRDTTAPRLELRAETRRDGDPSLVVHRVPVLAGEHPIPATPCLDVGLMWPGDPPSGSFVGAYPTIHQLWATSAHSRGGRGPRQCVRRHLLGSPSAVLSRRRMLPVLAVANPLLTPS